MANSPAVIDSATTTAVVTAVLAQRVAQRVAALDRQREVEAHEVDRLAPDELERQRRLAGLEGGVTLAAQCLHEEVACRAVIFNHEDQATPVLVLGFGRLSHG